MNRCYEFFYEVFHILPKLKLIVIIFFIGITICFSQNPPLPEKFQAALLVKVLKFSPTLSQKKNLRILIVDESDSGNKKELLENLLADHMDVKSIYPQELEEHISNSDVVFFISAIQPHQAELCKKNKVLSVSGFSENIEKGLVSLAFGVQNNKPKIFINLKSLGSEGQSLSSEILRIAEVF